MVESYGEYLAGLEGRGCRVIVQAAGHSVEEYVAAVELIEELCPWASGVEMNISCPNIARGRRAGGRHARERLRGRPRGAPARHRPLLVKMAPVRVPEIARACEAEGADALVAHQHDQRHVHRRAHSQEPPLQAYGRRVRPRIHAIAVRMVWEAAQAVKIPINGMGGIASWRDAAEMILAGATSVTVGTASFYDPTCASDIVDGLASGAAEQQGVADINELIGAFEC